MTKRKREENKWSASIGMFIGAIQPVHFFHPQMSLNDFERRVEKYLKVVQAFRRAVVITKRRRKESKISSVLLGPLVRLGESVLEETRQLEMAYKRLIEVLFRFKEKKQDEDRIIERHLLLRFKEKVKYACLRISCWILEKRDSGQEGGGKKVQEGISNFCTKVVIPLVKQLNTILLPSPELEQALKIFTQ